MMSHLTIQKKLDKKAMKNICLVAPKVEYMIYSIARAICSSDNQIYVLTSPKQSIPYRGHQFYYERLEAIENVTVVNEFISKKWDWVYFQLMPEINNLNLAPILSNAHKIGIISPCPQLSYPKTIWRQLKEIAKYFPVTSKCKRAILPAGFYEFDLYRMIAKKEYLGIDVHSNFLINEDLNKAMFAFEWSPQAKRKYKFNFIGNRNPSQRIQILELIKASLDTLQKKQIKGFDNSDCVWIEYGDEPGTPRGVPPLKFMEYLVESDFTLCPLGYSKLTHRVIEALVKGSIPLLNEAELSLYDIDLKDGVNCIAVKDGNWDQALERAVRMPTSEIHKIRTQIKSMENSFLSEEAFSNSLRRKMGL